MFVYNGRKKIKIWVSVKDFIIDGPQGILLGIFDSEEKAEKCIDEEIKNSSDEENAKYVFVSYEDEVK